MRLLFGSCSLLCGSKESFLAIMIGSRLSGFRSQKNKKPCAEWRHGFVLCSLRRNYPHQVQRVRALRVSACRLPCVGWTRSIGRGGGESRDAGQRGGKKKNAVSC